jgi:membrane fusion protein (multidrug efflux system)
MRNILPLTLALALAPGCEGESGAPLRGSPPPNAVEVERIEPLPFSDTLELVGQLAAEESVVIRPELSGVIDEIHFSEGNTVPEGEVLFTLRSEEQRATLREARANLVLARNVHGRTQKLSDSQVAADSELERTHAEVAAAEAAVERAAVELARTRIQAPFDGALGARHVSPGDRVEAGDALVQIDALERLQLQFSLPEAAMGLAQLGLSVEVEVAPYPDERFAGQVYFISPSLDPETRRLELKAWVPNGDRRLRPGLFAQERAERAISVPESAVVYDTSGVFVWRMTQESTAERVPVELGPSRLGRIVVRDGVSSGDTVVVSGTHKLYPGSPLLVAGEEAPVAGGELSEGRDGG